MKLISCHIENFGKFSNYDYRFQDGLNIIDQDNGWGKSTLSAFIRVMFYGFNGDGSRTDAMNERRRFAPWQGGIYGGTLTFYNGQKMYRIERIFGNTRKQDTFILYDNQTNLVSDDYSDNIGQELFHIDQQSFLRTVFAGQQDIDAQAGALISARIGSQMSLDRQQASAGNDYTDLASYDKAASYIRDELNRLSPFRSTGRIARLDQELTDLEIQLQNCRQAEADLEASTARQAELKESCRTIEESMAKSRGQINSIQDNYRSQISLMQEDSQALVDYAILQEKKAELDRKTEEYRKMKEGVFPQDIPSLAEFDQMQKDADAVLAYQNRSQPFNEEELALYRRMQRVFEQGVPTDDEILQISSYVDDYLAASSAGSSALTREEAQQLEEYRAIFGDRPIPQQDFIDQMNNCKRIKKATKMIQERQEWIADYEAKEVPEAGGSKPFFNRKISFDQDNRDASMRTLELGLCFIILLSFIMIKAFSGGFTYLISLILIGICILYEYFNPAERCVFKGLFAWFGNAFAKKNIDSSSDSDQSAMQADGIQNDEEYVRLQREIHTLLKKRASYHKSIVSFLQSFAITAAISDDQKSGYSDVRPEDLKSLKTCWNLLSQYRNYSAHYEQLLERSQSGQDALYDQQLLSYIEAFFRRYHLRVGDPSRYRASLLKLSSDARIYQSMQARLQDASDRRGQYLELVSGLSQFLRNYGISPEEDSELPYQIADLRSHAIGLDVKSQELTALAETIRRLESPKNTGDTAADTTANKASDKNTGSHIGSSDGSSFAAAASMDQYHQLELQLAGEQEKLHQLDIRQQELRGITNQSAELKEHKNNLSNERNKLQNQYDILADTMKYLEEAKNVYASRHMGQVLDSFKKYYELMTGRDSDQFEIDSHLNISLRELGALRSIDQLSEGQGDLVNICKRLAMIDAMYPYEKPFIIFDDPFVNLDDERVKRGLHFLDKIALDYQVIYFTCHQSRVL